MEYLVTPVRRAAEDLQDWTAVTGPEESPETLDMGLEYLELLDLLDPLDPKVRKENPGTSQTEEDTRASQESQESQVLLVDKVLMVPLVFLVQEGLMGTLVSLVLPVPQGLWGAAATDTKEREETRAMWVFQDPVVLLATGRS